VAAARADAAPSAAVVVPQRLPEVVSLVHVAPSALYIDAGSFGGLSYANILANRLVALGARVTTSYTAPRDKAYRVRIGPLGSVAEADRMLDRALAAGVNDAAIVVE
jgi:rare lipoprotein A